MVRRSIEAHGGKDGVRCVRQVHAELARGAYWNQGRGEEHLDTGAAGATSSLEHQDRGGGKRKAERQDEDEQGGTPGRDRGHQEPDRERSDHHPAHGRTQRHDGRTAPLK
jgi:hypothetical protein